MEYFFSDNIDCEIRDSGNQIKPVGNPSGVLSEDPGRVFIKVAYQRIDNRTSFSNPLC